MNKETIKNTYQRFEEEGIIYAVKSKDAKVPPRLRIASDWMPRRDAQTGEVLAQGRLWDFVGRIASSRREGKNRRDGATVSTRVIRLADMLGRKLFEEAAGPAGKTGTRLSVQEAAQVQKEVRAEKRRRKLEGRAHL